MKPLYVSPKNEDRRKKILNDSRIDYLNFGKTIRIKNITIADNRTYECFAADFKVGQLQKHLINVNVQSAPTLSMNSKIVYK
ncbi:hypothetical protein B4U80_05679, partial [Leptotrombidium deliense]